MHSFGNSLSTREKENGVWSVCCALNREEKYEHDKRENLEMGEKRDASFDVLFCFGCRRKRMISVAN